MTSRIEHTDVGAYALGLLEEDDRRAFEAHLSSCPSCTAELADLSGVAHALTGMGPVEEEEPAPEEIVDLLTRKKARDLRNRRGTLVIGVAAAITLVAGGVTVGSAIGGGTPSVHAGHDMGPAESFYAMGSPITGTSTAGASGGLVLEDKGWGTHAALMLAGVKGPLECELLAVSTTGERRVMTGWSVPPSGYGVPGSPSPLYMHGGSPFPRGRIDRFEVVTTTGKTLLTFDI